MAKFTSLNKIFKHSNPKPKYGDLVYAATRRDLKKVIELIEAGSDVNEVVMGSASPIRNASNTQGVEIVKALIEAKANVNIECGKGITPLMCAVQTGNIEIVKLLVEAGADIYKKNNSGLATIDQAKSEEVKGFLLSIKKQDEDRISRQVADPGLRRAVPYRGPVKISFS